MVMKRKLCDDEKKSCGNNKEVLLESTREIGALTFFT